LLKRVLKNWPEHRGAGRQGQCEIRLSEAGCKCIAACAAPAVMPQAAQAAQAAIGTAQGL
jgi:hypothetical protein